MKIIIKPRAQISITSIAFYIESKGYPETAIKFVNRLQTFINSLSNFPDKYPISKHKHFANKNFKQVPFERSYIIVYRVVDGVLYVHNIIHGQRLR